MVSGAAIGIDGAAHRGALAADGATVAVLACGVDRAYPAAHATLLERIAGDRPRRERVPAGQRARPAPLPGAQPADRGARRGTVVVEAALRSGAQRTAADTEALGRLVMAVPGPVTSGPSAGCHQLIRDGALLVTGADDVLEAVGRLGVDLAPEPEAAGPAARTAWDGPPPWCTTRCPRRGRATRGGWPASPGCRRTRSARR